MEQEKDSVKRMNIEDFLNLGYLQEVNRTFLHPLGLALEVVIDDENRMQLGGIWDYRDDKEGLHYDINNSEVSLPARVRIFNEKADFIRSEFLKRWPSREKELGFYIEPIPENKRKYSNTQ